MPLAQPELVSSFNRLFHTRIEISFPSAVLGGSSAEMQLIWFPLRAPYAPIDSPHYHTRKLRRGRSQRERDASGRYRSDRIQFISDPGSESRPRPQDLSPARADPGPLSLYDSILKIPEREVS